MTKIPWQTKVKSKVPVFVATAPSECLSVNQLQSSQVRFIMQLKRQLTNQRYTATTVFVDRFSHLQYVYLMQNLSLDKTIAAKKAFEQFLKQHRVTVCHYHCNNVDLLITRLQAIASNAKKNCRKNYLQFPGKCKQSALALDDKVAESHPHRFVVICSTLCRILTQHYPDFAR